MLWEQYDWSNMTNEERINTIREVVIPSYSQGLLYHIPQRMDILRNHGVRCDLLCCSDPRVNAAVFGCFPGEIYMKRAVGGMFDFGHPSFRAKFSRVLDKSYEENCDHLILISYHYSKRGQECGCAGHDKNDLVAGLYAEQLCNNARFIFAEKRFVFPVLCGIETDSGAVTLHGLDGTKYQCHDARDKEDGDIFLTMHTLFENFPARVLRYLVRLVRGNAAYVHSADDQDQDVFNSHNEFIVAYGEGFFPLPRARVMVVNPFEHPFAPDSHIIKAIGIQADLQRKGVIKNGFILASGAVYNSRNEKRWAIEETKHHLGVANSIMRLYYPDLQKKVTLLPLVMKRDTHELTFV